MERERDTEREREIQIDREREREGWDAGSYFPTPDISVSCRYR